MDEDRSESDGGRCGPSRTRRYELRLAGICLLWAVLFAGGTWLIQSDLLPAGPIQWAIAALPSFAAVYVVGAFIRFLRQADELQRLIQLQALALGFGGGFFVINGYFLFEKLGAPSAGAELTAVMPVLYAIGSLIGTRRYR